jgi:hypothetical protein
MSVFEKLTIKANTPEREFIAAIRVALRDYDQKTGRDRRSQNGKLGGANRTDPKKLKKGLEFFGEGHSLRESARKAGVSYGALWIAKERRKPYATTQSIRQNRSAGNHQQRKATP